jgi:hypothetical protein
MVMDEWCVGTESETDSSCTRDLKDIGLEYHSDLHLEGKIAEAGTYLWNPLKQNDDCYKLGILVEIEWMWETTSEPVSNPGS